MSESSTTRPAPTREGYEPPTQQSTRERMLIQMRKLGHVDHNGFPIAGPDPSVVSVVEPPTPGRVPSMATALAEVAAQTGADLATLLDSSSFCAAIAAISPADSAGLLAAIADHQPPVPSTGMSPDPAQHRASGGTVPTPRSGTLLERMHAQAEKASISRCHQGAQPNDHHHHRTTKRSPCRPGAIVRYGRPDSNAVRT
jgi:hypothetical protein